MQIWLVQDSEGRVGREVDWVVAVLKDFPAPRVEVTVLDLRESDIHRCIACDICPTDIDGDEVYRCIIHRSTDALKQNHSLFLEPDAVIVAALSPVDRSRLWSSYQRFIERTRYLRRGDYVLSDVVVAPLVFEELGSKENLHLRLLASMLRHHTVMTHPIVGYVQRGEVLNRDDVKADLERFVANTARVVTGRCVMISKEPPVTHYRPLGYVLSTAKDTEDLTIRQREIAVASRAVRLCEDARSRIAVRPV